MCDQHSPLTLLATTSKDPKSKTDPCNPTAPAKWCNVHITGLFSRQGKQYRTSQEPGAPNSFTGMNTLDTMVTQITTGANTHCKAKASPWGKGQAKLDLVCNVLMR